MSNLLRYGALPVVLVAVVGGCSDRGSDQPAARGDEHVWSAQTRALEKAREVEQLTRDAAERRARTIEQQEQ